MNNSFKIAELIAKKIKDEISEDEQSELDKWIALSPENRSQYEKSIDTKMQISKLKEYNSFNKNSIWGKIDEKTKAPKTINFRMGFLSYAAAILLPLLVLGGLTFNFLSKDEITLATIDENIKPVSQKAVLLLSDGTTVELNETNTEKGLNEKGVKIDIKNSQLQYTANNEKEAKKELVYNELKTPRGGGYNLKLADGTEVWLNAGSSLKFPVEFSDSTREVYIVGEAYFKVTHNGKPFIVKSQSTDIRVLGTSFNVSAYSDESLVTTTLVEGKVQIEARNVTSDDIKTVLTPGSQAVFDKTKEDMVVSEVVTSQYTSWTEGKLEFTNQELELVMKKLSRWYDFEYSFENERAKSYHFSARFNSDESISTILQMLEMTTNVKFEIENNTIVIL